MNYNFTLIELSKSMFRYLKIYEWNADMISKIQKTQVTLENSKIYGLSQILPQEAIENLIFTQENGGSIKVGIYKSNIHLIGIYYDNFVESAIQGFRMKSENERLRIAKTMSRIEGT